MKVIDFEHTRKLMDFLNDCVNEVCEEIPNVVDVKVDEVNGDTISEICKQMWGEQ